MLEAIEGCLRGEILFNNNKYACASPHHSETYYSMLVYSVADRVALFVPALLRTAAFVCAVCARVRNQFLPTI